MKKAASVYFEPTGITVHRTSLLHHTVRIAGPLLWNSLDSNVKSVTSLNTFRRQLKYLMLSQLDIYS